MTFFEAKTVKHRKVRPVPIFHSLQAVGIPVKAVVGENASANKGESYR
ncbi:hypothetical protein QRQ56_25255 [Bradyrhizobium sp. U531]